jgi:DegV family protein with EDD domain
MPEMEITVGKKIGIVTDSHSGISQELGEKLGVRVLPMPFYFGDECYYESKGITREEFYERLDSGIDVATSQPSPADVTALWDEALKEYDEIVHIPISSGLSGSCMMATGLASDEPYEGRVFVVDNGRVSTPQHRSVLDALEMVAEGYSGAQIKQMLDASADKNVIYIGVDTLEHLKKGGRISPATATLGTMLNIKPVLKFSTGTLDAYKKCRGRAKMKAAMLEAIKNDLNTTFKEYHDRNEVYLLAASSCDEEETAAWVREIEEAFPGMEVMCDYISFGVACHVGRGGLGVACSCRPGRI